MALQNIERGITDPELRAAVTPDFQIGCKRILISNTYYPALDEDHVDLVTDGIAEITPTGIVTNDGTTREVDAIIVATGFYTTEQPIAQHVKGRDGRTLADAWRTDGMSAYKGTTISGFPNLFQIVGPNTGLGHSSMVFIIESQIAYIVSALQQMGEQGIATVEPIREVQQRLERRPPPPDAAHRVEHRRLRELVPRRPRPQRHPLAAHHVRVPRAAARVRPRPVRRPAPSHHHHDEGARSMRRRTSPTRSSSSPAPAPAWAARWRSSPPATAPCSRSPTGTRQGLAETVDLVKAAGARELRSDVVDVSDRAAVGEWATAVVEQFGRVNVVVNNAGVSMTGDFEDMSYEEFDWIVGVNFNGVVNGTKEFLPHLIASGDGILVNISSLFGLISMPGQTAYNATKYAVRGFTEALREEMLINGHPVTVTCVHPGGIKTGISRNGRKTAGQDAAADRPPLRQEAGQDDPPTRRRRSSWTAPSPARRACSSASTPT